MNVTRPKSLIENTLCAPDQAFYFCSNSVCLVTDQTDAQAAVPLGAAGILRHNANDLLIAHGHQ
jgi:hypothetical protein